jgi:methyl-accepting chemotaxis protein
VSNDADRVLGKVLESSQKSTTMVRAIARATSEQGAGSRQLTEAMGRMAETMRQVSSVSGQQVQRTEHALKNADSLRALTQQIERSTSEQSRSSRQLAGAFQALTGTVGGVGASVRTQSDVARQASAAMSRVEDVTRAQDAALRQLSGVVSSPRTR